MTENQGRIELMQAAKRLGVAYHKALNLILRGALVGEKVNGHWEVELRSVDAYAQRAAKQPRGAR